ncbi:MAG: hypothetical protein DRO62_01925 [Candidatus Altiarchaeales archaeon]|nr:MAG: hypothetical protein DRO62_01925 [Candidatus Altiarchaeales archaeon]
MKKTGGLDDQCSILIETPVDQLQENIISVVGDLRSDGLSGIYVSINKPYKTINDIFIKNEINTDKIFFVDCITASGEGDRDNVSFIPDISDLSGLSIAISRFIDKIPNEKFLLIDAIHTLWIYHTPEFIARFIQNLTERSYRAGVKIIVFIVESEDKRLMRKLVPFFDQVIRLGG